MTIMLRTSTVTSTTSMTSVPSMTELNERVARGVALLNRLQPGWPSRVNVDTLSMISVVDCVLAQACNMTFHEARVWLRLRMDDAVECGFFANTSSDASVEAIHNEYGALTTLWCAVVKELRTR